MTSFSQRASLTGLIALLGGTLAMGCVKQSEYDKVVKEKKELESRLRTSQRLSAKRKAHIDKLEKEMAGVKDTLAGVKKELDDVKAAMGDKLKKSLVKMRKMRADLQRQMDELKRSRWAMKELKRIKDEMKRAQALNDRLKRAFQSMISAGRLKLINRNGRLVIQMQSKILFASGKAKMTREGKEALAQLAGILKSIKRHFQVAGHTDNVPVSGRKYADNWALSGHRATVVVRILEANGVPGRRLSAAGFGPHSPLRSNRTDAGKMLNRRIEITLLPSVPPRKLN